MKTPLNYFTLKRYKFKKKVDIEYVAKLLSKNNIEKIEIKNNGIYLEYNKTHFFIIQNRINNVVFVKRKINFIRFLISFTLPFFVASFKIGIENYLSNTLDTVVSYTVAGFVIFWIIYRFGFLKNENDELFIELLEGNIFNVGKKTK